MLPRLTPFRPLFGHTYIKHFFIIEGAGFKSVSSNIKKERMVSGLDIDTKVINLKFLIIIYYSILYFNANAVLVKIILHCICELKVSCELTNLDTFESS